MKPNTKRAQTLRKQRTTNQIERARERGLDIQGEQGWVQVGKMFTDPRYQRPQSPQKVAKIANDFDPDALGVVYLSDRGNDTYAVMDGGHRMEALRQLDWNDQLIPALVFQGLTLQEEAEIFTRMNKDRHQPHAVDIYRSEVTAGREQAVRLDAVLTGLAIPVSKANAPHSLRSIQTARRVISVAGEETLTRALKILKNAWNNTQNTDPTNTFNGDILSGVALLLFAEPEIDDRHLVSQLRNTTPGLLLNKARAAQDVLGSLPAASMVHVLTTLYNARRRSGRLALPTYNGWPKRTANGVLYGNGWSRDEEGPDDGGEG